ncbi:MAG: HAD hydrolase-like protein [Phaeodactylibacter sp.]|nr:HAD hydrolase-like protein [Phaeodactylibacter sp.]
MQDFKLVVFDMAGTTVKDEKEVENCFFEAAQKSGLAASRSRINAMQGLPKLIVIETLWAEAIGRGHEAYAEKVAETYRLFREILENHYLSHPIQPTEGALEVFNWLRRQDIKIALTTGFYRKVCNIILHRLGWDAGLDEHYLGGADSIIQLSLTPDETDKGRPHPDMIWKAMEMLDVADAGQVIKVGDTPSDLQAGRAAGCGLTLGVTNGTHTHQELAAHPNDGLLPSMKAFVSFLEEKQYTIAKYSVK